jgi:acetyltransferase-like isoleucine patch superfamily enzyme
MSIVQDYVAGALSRLNTQMLKRTGVSVGPGVRCHGRPLVSLASGSSVSIGPGTTLISSSKRTDLGVSRPVIIRTLTSEARIRIGADCGLSGSTLCAAIGIELGNRVLLGADVMLVDTDFHIVDAVPRRHQGLPPSYTKDMIRIADDVFIGARSIVLKGVSVGAGSVIGAGSVVSRSIPGGVVAAGNPARVLRPLSA